MQTFRPLFRGAHAATIAASLWPRQLSERRFPVEARLIHTEPDVRILVHVQRPEGQPKGEAVLVHGLEGSSHSPYMISLAQELLQAGYIVHRTNIRSCGGTDFFCKTLYHAGFTSDLFTYLMSLDRDHRTPVHLIGFSLGANQVLKLAGELRRDGATLLRSVCAVSAPIDLEACAIRLGARDNFLYEWWFLSQMKKRLQTRRQVLELPIPWDALPKLRTIYELDDKVTAPAFGFRGAAEYYKTQSAQNFLEQIRVPTVLVQAKDDPLIPFSAFSHPAIDGNRHLRLVATDHGGHVGFLAKAPRHFWLDGFVRQWLDQSKGRESSARPEGGV